MANCTKCGAPLVEGAMFCPSCGQAVAQPFEMGAEPEAAPFEEPTYGAQAQQFEQPQYQQPDYQQPYGYDPYGMQPYGNDKMMGVIAYITLIGFLVALFAGANNGRRTPYLNFHLNQSLIIIIANFITGIITAISATVGNILSLVIFVFWVMAIVGAFKGETKSLPFIEGIKLIK